MPSPSLASEAGLYEHELVAASSVLRPGVIARCTVKAYQVITAAINTYRARLITLSQHQHGRVSRDGRHSPSSVYVCMPGTLLTRRY
jgi:hypothetical protein